jgi:hypothetical protein
LTLSQWGQTICRLSVMMILVHRTSSNVPVEIAGADLS